MKIKITTVQIVEVLGTSADGNELSSEDLALDVLHDEFMNYHEFVFRVVALEESEVLQEIRKQIDVMDPAEIQKQLEELQRRKNG